VSVLDRKLRREMLQSKGLLGAIVAIIAVGAACFVSMLATYNNLEIARVEFYAHCRMADFWIDVKKVPEAEVERLRTVPGVAEVSSRIVFPVVVDFEDVDRPLGGLVVSLPEEEAPILNNIILKRGHYFTDRRPEEVILSEKFAQARGIRPGDFVRVVMNRQLKKLFVVGTAVAAEFTYLTPPGAMVPDPSGYGLYFVKREFAEEVFDFEGAANSVVGLFTPEAEKNPEPVLAELERRLAPYGVFVKTPLENQVSNLAIRSEIAGIQTFATILPVIFFAVAALVLNVLMGRMVEQQRVVIGTLKALGYSDRQVLGHYLEFGLAVGVAGGVLGCGVGYAIEVPMIRMYNEFFEFPRLLARVYPGVMGLAVAVAVFFSVLGSLRGVRAVLRLNAAEAMRPGAPARVGRIGLERWRFFWSRLDFRWQMVFRGLFRNRLRTAIGVLASALGSSLVLAALGMSDALVYMIDFQFEKVFRSDYMLTFKDEVDAGAVDEARRMPGVFQAEPELTVPCAFHHGHRMKRGAVTGILPDAELTLPHGEGGRAEPVPPAGLLMARRLAEFLDLSEGESVTFIPIKGLRRSREVPVTRLIDSTVGLAVYADYRWLNRLMGESEAVTGVQLLARQTAAEKKAFLRNLKRYPLLESVSDVRNEQAKLEHEFVDMMNITTTVLILFAGVIFFGSILNGSLIALAERTREIATFRALGYRRLEVGTIFLRENLLVNLTGAVLGLPLGWVMLYGLAVGFQNDLYAMPCVVFPATWILTPLIALAFALLAHLIVQRDINRQAWQEAIRLKE